MLGHSIPNGVKKERPKKTGEVKMEFKFKVTNPKQNNNKKLLHDKIVFQLCSETIWNEFTFGKYFFRNSSNIDKLKMLKDYSILQKKNLIKLIIKQKDFK